MAPPLRILCFGASITAGWHRGGLAFHPYAIRLKSRLQEHFPPKKIEIDVDAFPGDYVIGGFYLSRYLDRQKAGQKYDWVIIQGGGNDLMHGTPPETIYEQLQKIWSTVLDNGSKVMALTVTETADRRPQKRNLYDDLNRRIREHPQEGVEVADVCSALPWPNDPKEAGKIWDDGLHFTPLGYDMLGEAIFQQLEAVLQNHLPAKI